MWSALSDKRTGSSFTIAAGLASAVIPGSESHGTHDHILLSQIRDSHNLEGQVSVFISPRNMVAQLYAQALGSLFVASYDSQGYGGGTSAHLHVGITATVHWLGKLQLAFASTVIPDFSLLKIHDQDFDSLLDMYVWGPLFDKGGVGLAM
jgi:hypothetical protein